jgi:NHL repeat
MHVSLAPARAAPPSPAGPLPQALLSPSGAQVILGPPPTADGLAIPIVPGPSTLFGPRGACLTSPTGALVVCDTGHHRLLVWRDRPTSDAQPADLLIGQPDFASEGRNAKGEVSASSLNVPTGVAWDNGVLAVADAWNHRVLLWHGLPRHANQPADVVLGQADFISGLANRGADAPRADTLHWCYGVLLAGGRLFVSDTGNRRVLVWNQVPTRTGTPADLVLGQRDFTTRDENASAAPGPVGMRWPHAITFHGEQLLVADAGNNRVMGWHHLPASLGAPCDFVMGQADAHHVDHNRAGYYPTASTVNMPYGAVTFGGRLVLADTANSRLLGFDQVGAGDPAATALAGQDRFIDKGDNRWGTATRDSVCWPYNVSATGETLVVADSGNNRVMLWERA